MGGSFTKNLHWESAMGCTTLSGFQVLRTD